MRPRFRQLLHVVELAGMAIVAWLVIGTIVLWITQERVVFQPPQGISIDPSAARRVEVRASDGHPGYAYVIEPAPAPRGNGTVVLAFHGNADLAFWMVPWAREVARRTGATVIVPEYRGYGGSTGTPSYDGVAADSRGALDYARSLKPARLVFFGHSLGTAIAVELASAGGAPDAIALQSPFTSARAMALRMLVPAVPLVWNRISRVHYDTKARVSQLEVPVWVAHGRLDITIPSRMGKEVFEASKRRGELLVIATAGHNDVPDAGGEEYWRWLTAAVTGASAPVGKVDEQGGRRLP